MEEEPQEEPTSQEALKDTVDRLEKANAEKARLLQEEQELAAKRLLGGQTEKAPQPEPPKEDTPKEYSDKLTRGEIKFTS